jgi:3-phosphoshikimate 1-carboxyvinyltransferase
VTDVYEVAPVAGAVDATVTLPGSKSITNRAVLAAGLAPGQSLLTGALVAEDTEAMLSVVSRLGAGVELDPAWAAIEVDGIGGRIHPGPLALDARQSGTTARFLLPVLATGSGEYTLDGDRQLRRRPMGHGFDALRAAGVTVVERGSPGRLPVTLVGGGLPDEVEVAGDVSSQFLSGLLLAGPLLPRGLRVRLTTGLVSRPYVDLTVAVMAAFGVDTAVEDDRFVVPPGGYRARVYAVEPDASAASYFLAAAAVCGGRVAVPGLGRRSRQGDLAFADVLGRMGARVEWDDDRLTVERDPEEPLHGVEADLSAFSDTAPTLAVVAAMAQGPTRITGIGFIRAKESDRIAAIVGELRRCGVDASEEDDGFVVRPGSAHGAGVDPHGDHRMAMAFAVLGLAVPGMSIIDPGCVAKTFPDFWAALEALGR